MDLGLNGRVAIVTGAASGIGRACTELLIGEGCRVVATDIQDEPLRELAASIGGECTAVVADASTPEGAVAPVDAARREYGRLDVLVLSAGVFGTARGGALAGDEGASTIEPAQWDLTQAINVRGPFLCAQAAIDEMALNGWGRIVAIASVAGQMGGFRAGADYAASKAAVAGMVRSMACTAGPLGITVNVINPGMIKTPMLKDNVRTDYTSAVAERSALRRLGTAEEVASMAVMLASEGAGYATGSHIDVNGGFYFG